MSFSVYLLPFLTNVGLLFYCGFACARKQPFSCKLIVNENKMPDDVRVLDIACIPGHILKEDKGFSES